MANSSRPILALILATGALGAPPETSHQKLARDIFRELVEINTTQRLGSTKAAEAVAARLKAANFPAADVQLVGPRPEKMNLVVRLRGKGTAKPILFIAHLDVVEARPEDWSPGLHPFRFIERDGYFYGRGTSDVKDEAAVLVASFIRLKQEGFVPDRDLIVALTDDEEGGSHNGIEWLLKNRRELIDAAWCINTDAGGGLIEKGRRLRYTLQTSEKAVANFRLEVKNVGGHSSQPIKDNAIYHLAEGLARLAKFDFPVQLNDTTRSFFERMSMRENGQIAADMKAIANPAARARLAHNTMLNSIMRTTCVATTMEAGHATNALPQTARAVVNCRVLPADTQAAVQQTLVKVLADPQITVTPMNAMRESPASPLTPQILGMIDKLVGELWPGVPVVPVMDPWASDSIHLRRAGIATYGAPAMFFNTDPIRAHGQDERIGVESFYEGLEFMYRLMMLSR